MGILNHNPFIYSDGKGIVKTFRAADGYNLVPLYTPQLVPNFDNLYYTAHLQSLRATIAISSTAEVDFPEMEDYTPRAERIQAMRNVEWGSERKQLDILIKTEETDWELVFSVSLLNRTDLPYYQVNLLKYLTGNADFGLGTDVSLAARIAYVNFGALEGDDRVTIVGTVKQEALYYKETELLPNIIVSPARVVTTVNIDALGRWDATDNQEYVQPLNTLFGFIHRMTHGETGILPGELEDGNGNFLDEKPFPIHYESQVLINPTVTNDTHWGDGGLEDTHMVLTRIEDGNGDLGTLTIKPDVLLTTNGRKLGLIILCDRLICQGTISMSQRGANHSGTGISGGETTATDIMLTSGTIVKGEGGFGGQGFTTISTRSGNNGLPGSSSSGGGGTGVGAIFGSGGTANVGRGSQGTIFSGGSGTGGITAYNGITFTSANAGENGGKGSIGSPDTWSGNGAGNPHSGTGGFLAIYARTSMTIDTPGQIQSTGSDGFIGSTGNYAPGGPSGGGIIFLATRSLIQNGTIDVAGGQGSLAIPLSGSTSEIRSGNGGDGAYILEDLGTP